jgi:hypothetical protein
VCIYVVLLSRFSYLEIVTYYLFYFSLSLSLEHLRFLVLTLLFSVVCLDLFEVSMLPVTRSPLVNGDSRAHPTRWHARLDLQCGVCVLDMSEK